MESSVYVIKATSVDYEEVAITFEINEMDTLKEASFLMTGLLSKIVRLCSQESNQKFKTQITPNTGYGFTISKIALQTQEQLNQKIGVSGNKIIFTIEKKIVKACGRIVLARITRPDYYESMDMAA